MGAVMWLIAGVNLTFFAQALPSHDWFHLISGLIFLTIGMFV